MAKSKTKVDLEHEISSVLSGQGEADPNIYACPDGPLCRDPACVEENKRRASMRTPNAWTRQG